MNLASINQKKKIVMAIMRHEMQNTANSRKLNASMKHSGKITGSNTKLIKPRSDPIYLKREDNLHVERKTSNLVAFIVYQF